MTTPTTLSELDALLAESQGNSEEQMLDLDELLLESINIVDGKQQALAAKKRLLQGNLSTTQLAEDIERLRQWEMRNVWRPEANVVRFVEQECSNCGDAQYLFTGLLQRQSHRHDAVGQKRWVSVEVQDAALPNEIMVEAVQSPFCGQCCEQMGFTWNTVYAQDGTPLEYVGEVPPEGQAPDTPDLTLTANDLFNQRNITS